MTWLASNCMGKLVPNSDANEFMGDRVPDVKMIVLTSSPTSEKAWKMHKKR